MKKITLNLFILTLTVSTYGFEREYVKGAVLTNKQEKTVIELAKKAGIKKVAKILSHNMFPSPFRGLRVEGVEQIKNHKVSYEALSISHGEWLQPGAKPRKGQIQLGNFWAGKPYTRKKTILWVDEKEYRAGSVQGITIEECETILSLFLRGEYDHNPEVCEKALTQIDWTKPSRFGKQGSSISVGFPHKHPGEGFFDLKVKLDGKKLNINKMFQAVP